MSAVDKALAIGDFINFVDKNGALGLQLFHHIAVMNDLFTYIDRRAKRVQGNTDDIDGSYHSGAKTPGLKQQQSIGFWCHCDLLIIPFNTLFLVSKIPNRGRFRRSQPIEISIFSSNQGVSEGERGSLGRHLNWR